MLSNLLFYDNVNRYENVLFYIAKICKVIFLFVQSNKYMDYKLIEKIEKLGLSHKESLVYVTLLQSGGGYPSKISTLTKLNRSTTYKILTALSIKGLATEIEQGKKIYYQPEPLSKLGRYVDYQVERAELARMSVHKILPELENILGNTDNPRVVFYRGYDQVVAAYMRHVETDQSYDMCAWVNVTDLKKFLPPKSFKHYREEKQRIGITARGITSDSGYSQKFTLDTHAHIQSKRIWPQLRYVPEDMFPYPAEITLFDQDKVSLIKFDERDPIGIIIQDKMVHDMMKMIFNSMWNSLSDEGIKHKS